MTLRAPSLASGSPDNFRVPWKSFVQLVLEITVEAYRRMRQDGVARQDWEEDAFTVKLTEDYIQPLTRQHKLNLIAKARTRVHTPSMKTGAVSPKRASEIDIQLFHPWVNYNQIYFAWECKRVGDKRVDTGYAVLISQYVTEGIFRFIDEDYAAGLNDAGMLGYVLGGGVVNIVDNINASMDHPRRKRQLSTSDHLVPAPAVATLNDVYHSHHRRTISQKAIRLHQPVTDIRFRRRVLLDEETTSRASFQELFALEQAHRELAAPGRACTQKVADWLASGGPGDVRSIGKLRSMVREMLAEEFRDIDGLVEPLLKGE